MSRDANESSQFSNALVLLLVVLCCFFNLAAASSTQAAPVIQLLLFRLNTESGTVTSHFPHYSPGETTQTVYKPPTLHISTTAATGRIFHSKNLNKFCSQRTLLHFYNITSLLKHVTKLPGVAAHVFYLFVSRDTHIKPSTSNKLAGFSKRSWWL